MAECLVLVWSERFCVHGFCNSLLALPEKYLDNGNGNWTVSAGKTLMKQAHKVLFVDVRIDDLDKNKQLWQPQISTFCGKFDILKLKF